MRAHDRFCEANGLRFHLREWGKPGQPPVLILHGLTGHAWEFDRLAAGLSEHFHVLALNQRGHGASSWSSRYSPQAMAQDVYALVEELGLERVRVVGHSLGAVNGWWLASMHPACVDRIALTDVEPGLIASAAVHDAWQQALSFYAQARYGDPEQAVAEYLADYAGRQPEALREFVLNNIVQLGDGTWRWRFDADRLMDWMNHASGDEQAHWQAIERVACPVLVIRGGESPFTRADRMKQLAARMAKARYVEIPASGHDVHIDQRERLLVELVPFLQHD